MAAAAASHLRGLVEHTNINGGSQQVVGGCDGMDVTCHVEVELLHGDNLRARQVGVKGLQQQSGTTS